MHFAAFSMSVKISVAIKAAATKQLLHSTVKVKTNHISIFLQLDFRNSPNYEIAKKVLVLITDGGARDKDDLMSR